MQRLRQPLDPLSNGCLHPGGDRLPIQGWSFLPAAVRSPKDIAPLLRDRGGLLGLVPTTESPVEVSFRVVNQGLALASGAILQRVFLSADPVVGDDTWVIAGPHPADLNPVDWRLGMDELTAYGAAWRTGGVWSCEPNPIPITYVSRAAALWRGGETYTVDPSITTPPLWWVNRLGGGPSAKFDLGLTGTAQRSLPAGFLATEPVDVTLSVKPVSTTSAYAVEESLPAGTRLVSVADGGALDALQSRVKWGPYLDNSPRVLRYRVVLPQPEGGLLQFAGAASFDGDLVTTLGPNKVRSTSLLTCGAPPQSGQWDLLLRGDLGAVYELQTSTDLARWTALSRFTNSSGTVRIPLSIVPGTTQLYYRANLVSP